MGDRDEVERLAHALAATLVDARPTSRFAIETFLRAVSADGVIGAELTLSYDHRRGHIEAEAKVAAPNAR